MYTLEPIKPLREVTEYARQRIDDVLQTLSDSTQGLEFDPVLHRYVLGQRELPSVSSIVERFAPFDAQAKALSVSKNPKHKLYGKSVEEILALWEENKNAAATAGTEMHEFGEACYSFLVGNLEEIPERLMCRLGEQGLVAESPKEVACALWWAEMDWNRYKPVAKETRIANPELNYAGTFDLLLYDTLNDRFALRDYKTNEDLYKWYGDYLQAPLNTIRSNDIGKYTLQQTSYVIELENIDIDVQDASLIWLKQNEYENVPIDLRYAKLIRYALAQLNNIN